LKRFNKGRLNAKKRGAQFVNLLAFNDMANPNKTSKDSDAMTAQRASFGKDLITKSTANNIGSGSGSPKVIRSGNYPRSQATVLPNSNVLKIIGLNKRRPSCQITQSTSTSFMMALTSTKMAASSVL